MGDKKPPPDTSSLYAELSKFQQTQDFEKGVKVCNKILSLAPADTTAFHCKIVCMVQTGKFQETLKQIEDTHFKIDLAFEEAYCYYRLNETEKALEAIKKAKNPEVKHKELKAQILYRLEQFDESYDVYKDILKNSSDDDFETERMTNMSAVAANLKRETKLQISEETFELKYNRACFLLSQGKWSDAEKLLLKSEEMCKAALQEDEEAEEEDIVRETGIIKVQLAFALQMQGREKEAQALYNQVLRSKPTDIGLVAVASNNLLTINKDQNIFDSKKKIKAATVDGLEHKLTLSQRRTIAKNHALLAMFTNQVDLCKTLLSEWSTKFEDVPKDEQDLILAGALSRSGKTMDAVDLLLASDLSDLEKRLIAAQVFLEKGDVKNGINMLESLPANHRYRNGVLSSLVALHLACEGRNKAAQLLKEAVEWNSTEKRDKSDMRTVWRKTAEFHLKGDDPKIAVQCLEQLLVNNERDKQLLAQLVLAYARFDLKKALDASKKLPNFVHTTVDIDALESSSFMGSKISKKTPKLGGVPSPKPDDVPTTDLARKKNKKKRKKKLPKNFNPNVDPDPERWLPRRERTGFKKRKDRRRQEKFTGAQGTAAGQSEVFDYSSKKASVPVGPKGATPKSPAVEAPSGVGPRQQQRKPQPKKKKSSKRF